MKHYILAFLVFLSCDLFGQNPPIQNTTNNSVSLLEEKIKSLEEKNNKLQEELEKNEQETLGKLSELKKDTNDNIGLFPCIRDNGCMNHGLGQKIAC
jgi:hypothetical protein